MITNKYFITTRNIPTYIKYLIAKKQSGGQLPEGYQELEYIESTGTQYIDTGIVLNNGCVITLDFLTAESSVNRIIYGWRRKGRYTDPYQAMIGANASKRQYIAFGRTSTNIPQCFRTDVRNKILIDSVNEQVLVNDIVMDCGADFSNGKAFNENGSSEVHPYLFALNNAGTPLTISQDTRIYRYSVQYGDELLQSFIPCYRKADTKPGMYDLVNDVFYTNAGTGEFSYREDIWIPELEVNGTSIQMNRATCVLNEDEYTFNCTGVDMSFGSVYTSTGNQWNPRMGTLYDITDVKKLELILTNTQFDKNYITFYDENQQSIGMIKFTSSNGNVDVPEGAKYCNVRFGINLSQSGSVYKTKVHLIAYK